MNQYSRQPANPNPNTVLVVFLVCFVLLSIGLGVWGYLGFEAQEEMRQALITKDKQKVEPAVKAEKYFTFVSLECRAAIGDSLSADELNEWQVLREEFFKPGGKYADGPSRPAVEKLIQDMKAQLAGFNDVSKKYEYSYKMRIDRLNAELGKALDACKKAQEDSLLANQSDQNRKRKFDDFAKEMREKYEKEAAERKKAFAEQSAAVLEAIKVNQLQAKEADKRVASWREKYLQEKSKNDNALLNPPVADNQDPKKGKVLHPGIIEPAVKDANSSPAHALLLDLSFGRPMWDKSLGKIKSVTGRKVIINLGSQDGVRTGLTFNIFEGKEDISKSDKGLHPSKRLKGTIEVGRDIKEHTAEAQITEEINPKNPIKENDLLFNMFWRTHVVVAGQIDWFGLLNTRADSMAEQVRNLDQFREMLENQGVIVDAFVDLTDGSIKGTVSDRARFLILGHPPYISKFGSRPEPTGDGNDDPDEADNLDLLRKNLIVDLENGKVNPDQLQNFLDQIKKPAEKNAKPKAPLTLQERLQGLARKRNLDIAKGIQKLQGQCVNKGMFIISAENYAHIVGLQRFRATNGPEELGFRPRNTYAD